MGCVFRPGPDYGREDELPDHLVLIDCRPASVIAGEHGDDQIQVWKTEVELPSEASLAVANDRPASD